VVVGADPILHARSDDPGKEPGLLALGELFAALGEFQIPIQWRTRAGIGGNIPAPLLDGIKAARGLVTVEIGFSSLDINVARALEGPLASDPEQRLHLAAALSARGIPVRALIEPLVPMLTDQRAALDKIFHRLDLAGIHRVAVRYLVLTPGRAKVLSPRLSRLQRELLLACFAEEPWRKTDPNHTPHHGATSFKLLPGNLRQSGHRRIVHAASRVGIAVEILDPVADSEIRVPTNSQGAAQESGSRSPRRQRKSTPPRRAAKDQMELFGGTLQSA
jgi:hypothetical protein